MAPPRHGPFTLAHVHAHARYNGYEAKYALLHDSNYIYCATSMLGANDTPAVLLGKCDGGPDKMTELWGVLVKNNVIFIRNESPTEGGFEISRWTDVPNNQNRTYTEGVFTYFDQPGIRSAEEHEEDSKQVKALVKALLLEAHEVHEIGGQEFFTDLQIACQRFDDPIYRLTDFEKHGQQHFPEIYERLSNPSGYSVEEKTVQFDDGVIKRVLCVRIGSEAFEKNGKQAWGASVDGKFHLFHVKPHRAHEGLVEYPRNRPAGPAGLGEPYIHIRRGFETVKDREKSEQRLAAFLNYIYLVTGKVRQVQGRDLLTQFGQACKAIVDGAKKVTSHDAQTRKLKLTSL